MTDQQNIAANADIIGLRVRAQNRRMLGISDAETEGDGEQLATLTVPLLMLERALSALLALIEERDRLKVERDEAVVGWTFEFLGYDGDWGRSFAFLDQGEPENGTGAIVRNVVPVRRAT